MSLRRLKSVGFYPRIKSLELKYDYIPMIVDKLSTNSHYILLII